jgi:polar amino acid transport system ATP-binding protein
MTSAPFVIKASNLNKSFNALQVLRNVSVEVEAGRTVVLIGPSGSGKSTLLRCLNLLETIDSGTILFDGHDITNLGKHAYRARREIGMVFQNFELFPHLTALENIILAPVQVKGVAKREAIGTAKELLAKVRIPEKADFYPDELSGGQQQRVAIARALAMKPKMMLYDEPTSALDPEMIKEVLDVIQALSREGMTSMIVTHEMAFARRVADRVLFMDGGRIVDDLATPDFFAGETSQRARSFLEQILYH